MSSWTIHNAEAVAWAKDELARIARGESTPYHALLCDPPYGIAFMGKTWDDHGGPAAFQAQAKIWGEALMPLLYPGALVFMFGGTRTWHRLAAGMEDAGFQMWDTLLWLHGQGFPKAQDISKLIDKRQGALGTQGRRFNAAGGTEPSDAQDKSFRADYGYVYSPASELSSPWVGYKTAQLKPAWEPVLCFRAPDDGKPYAELALTHGSGALNIDGARIETQPRATGATRVDAEATTHGIYGRYALTNRQAYDDNLPSGRYPANVALECTCEHVEAGGEEPGQKISIPGDSKQSIVAYGKYGPKVYERRPLPFDIHTDPNCPCFQLDEQVGESFSSGGTGEASRTNKGAGAVYGWQHPAAWDGMGGYKDRGGPSRFFYRAKAKPKPERIGRRGGSGFGFFDDEKSAQLIGRWPADPGGGPSRFFYCTKASRGEREAGLDGFQRGVAHPQDEQIVSTRSNRRCIVCLLTKFSQPHCVCAEPQWEETAGSRVANTHPTVKPIGLATWLATLLLPPAVVNPRRILIPFSGVASEMVGCLLAGWDEVVGVEVDEKFSVLGKARLEHWALEGDNAEPTTGTLNRPEKAAVLSVTERAQGSFF